VRTLRDLAYVPAALDRKMAELDTERAVLKSARDDSARLDTEQCVLYRAC
jgi:hypothetical protein